MADDFTVQINAKLADGTLINFRGQSVGDVLSDVRELAESSGDLVDALSVMQAAGRAVNASNPDARQNAPAATPQAQPAAAQPGGAPSCDHGARFYKETKVGSGKFVYECAAVADGRLKWNDAGACKGVWVNNRR